jgi:hypothetical protein
MSRRGSLHSSNSSDLQFVRSIPAVSLISSSQDEYPQQMVSQQPQPHQLQKRPQPLEPQQLRPQPQVPPQPELGILQSGTFKNRLYQHPQVHSRHLQQTPFNLVNMTSPTPRPCKRPASQQLPRRSFRESTVRATAVAQAPRPTAKFRDRWGGQKGSDRIQADIRRRMARQQLLSGLETGPVDLVDGQPPLQLKNINSSCGHNNSAWRRANPNRQH